MGILTRVVASILVVPSALMHTLSHEKLVEIGPVNEQRWKKWESSSMPYDLFFRAPYEISDYENQYQEDDENQDKNTNTTARPSIWMSMSVTCTCRSITLYKAYLHYS